MLTDDVLKTKFEKQDVHMLFETCRPDSQNRNTYFFQNPVKSLIAYDRASAEKALDDIEGLIQRKYWIAGYFSYELGYGFEMDSFPAEHKYNNPLLELYAFKKPEIQNASRNISSGRNKDFKASNIKFNIPYSQYKRNIGKIKRYIEKGDVYQINYTGKLKFKFKGDSFSFYRSLTEKQEVPYSAFLKLKNETVISLSPELFFSVKNGVIESKPMKGTMNRGRDLAEDTAKMKELRESSKNRAENIMITDLIRNDLGRICRTGSIHTSKIYEVIKYNTLLQMITTVRGRLSKGITWKEIFKSIFPGGSITGAPKIRAMQIIRELEKENKHMVRLLLSKNGKVECLSSALTPRKNIKEKAVISSARVDSKNKYLYHKTTLRKLYEKEREKIKEKDIFDVIFLNEKKEVTEGAITNIFIEKKGKYYTPPVSSGLLPGVYREYLLKEKKAVQQILKIKDLKLADRIYLVNSVRGIVEVEIAF